MWRCFHRHLSDHPPEHIFSTYVEVFLSYKGGQLLQGDFLHVCGGVSAFQPNVPDIRKFSPRMWRCFFFQSLLWVVVEIFSTYVEVFLSLEYLHQLISNFLHVCGGVSKRINEGLTVFLFSPRMWRCFPLQRPLRLRLSIFSTYVEVFLKTSRINGCATDFLHVCGGVSALKSIADIENTFSPRMWRCFYSSQQR